VVIPTAVGLHTFRLALFHFARLELQTHAQPQKFGGRLGNRPQDWSPSAPAGSRHCYSRSELLLFARSGALYPHPLAIPLDDGPGYPLFLYIQW